MYEIAFFFRNVVLNILATNGKFTDYRRQLTDSLGLNDCVGPSATDINDCFMDAATTD